MGSEIINYLIDKLKISETLLAGLLDVTPKTLDEWKEINFIDGFKYKEKRLDNMKTFIDELIKAGVQDSELLAFLNEPINKEDDESFSPLYLIVHYEQEKK